MVTQAMERKSQRLTDKKEPKDDHQEHILPEPEIDPEHEQEHQEHEHEHEPESVAGPSETMEEDYTIQEGEQQELDDTAGTAEGDHGSADDEYDTSQGDEKRRGAKPGHRGYKKPLPVREHTSIDPETGKRLCVHCGCSLSINVTRIKTHMLEECTSIPSEIRANLAAAVSAQTRMGKTPPKRTSKASYSSVPKVRRFQIVYGNDPHGMYSQIELGEGGSQNISDDLNALISTLSENHEHVVQNGSIPSGPLMGKTGVEDIREYMERLDHLIAGLCRIRSRLCKSILTKHKREGDFAQAVRDLRLVIDKARRASIIS